MGFKSSTFERVMLAPISTGDVILDPSKSKSVFHRSVSEDVSANFNDEMSAPRDDLFTEVFDHLPGVKNGSQDDCLNSFYASKLFSPLLQSERARYNFLTGLALALEGVQRTRAAAGLLPTPCARSVLCE